MSLAIRQLSVPREHKQIFQGQNVNMMATFVDSGITSILFDPDHVPTLSLFDPLNSVLLNNVEMTRLSTGLYQYVYQSDMDDVVGVYTTSVQAQHEVVVARLERISTFKILQVALAPFLEVFTAFGIKDQLGIVHYWFVDAAVQLDHSYTLPMTPGRTARLLNPLAIPYWLQISNATPAVRYVYPEVTGEFAVSAVVPPIGTGYIESPVFTAVSLAQYTITLDIADQIVLETY